MNHVEANGIAFLSVMRVLPVLVALWCTACASGMDSAGGDTAAIDRCFGLTGEWMEGRNRGISFSPAPQSQFCLGYWTSCKLDFHLKRLDPDDTADLTHFATQRSRNECPLEGDKCRIAKQGDQLTVNCGRGALVYQKAPGPEQ